MSHIPQRKEKDCLNCGTVVQDKYCHVCGQENVVPHETFWHMLQHFLYDITHFDSKFFDSMKYLLLKPGFLPKEYMKGRRAGYLNPVKKYVFTSAVFFIIFFSLFKAGDSVKININQPLTKKERAKYIKRGREELQLNPDNEMWKTAMQMLQDTTKVLTEQDLVKYRDDFNFINLGGRQYKDKREYDSVQKILPSNKKDSWLKKIIQQKNLQLKEKYKNDPGSGANKLVEIFLHKLPYLLFVSLPLFALILKLLYIRRKNFYYADHGIFSIYHYIFSFILLLLVLGLDKLDTLTGWKIIGVPEVLLFLSGGIYLYLSMKKFYQQSRFKTWLKFLLLNIAGIVMLILLFTGFVIFSVFEI